MKAKRTSTPPTPATVQRAKGSPRSRARVKGTPTRKIRWTKRNIGGRSIGSGLGGRRRVGRFQGQDDAEHGRLFHLRLAPLAAQAQERGRAVDVGHEHGA